MKKLGLFLVVTGIVVAVISGNPQLSLASMKDSKMMKGTMMDEKMALGGFCPTCLIHGKKIKGKAEFTSVFDSKTYLFSSKETKDYFDQNPAENAKAAQMKYDQEIKMMDENMDGMKDKMGNMK